MRPKQQLQGCCDFLNGSVLSEHTGRLRYKPVFASRVHDVPASRCNTRVTVSFRPVTHGYQEQQAIADVILKGKNKKTSISTSLMRDAKEERRFS